MIEWNTAKERIKWSARGVQGNKAHGTVPSQALAMRGHACRHPPIDDSDPPRCVQTGWSPSKILGHGVVTCISELAFWVTHGPVSWYQLVPPGNEPAVACNQTWDHSRLIRGRKPPPEVSRSRAALLATPRCSLGLLSCRIYCYFF